MPDSRPSPRTTFKPQVVLPALAVIGALLVVCALHPSEAGALFSAGQQWVIARFDWFYVLAVTGFLVFLVLIAASDFGNIRLGPDDAEPEFSFVSWTAMLFAAGMGIGLMYFGVGEPMQHFLKPPTVDPGTPAAAREAMLMTFFHWGFHAWAIYGLMGLVLAYFGFRYNLPLTLRSGLYPVLRERINGWIGHTVDAFALVGTVAGIATTLGYGVMQLSAGLHTVAGWDTGSNLFRIGLVAVVVVLAGVSAATGLDKGVRRLSELNLLLAFLLLAFVVVAGPTAFLLRALGDNIGQYLSSLVDLSFRTYAYAPPERSAWTMRAALVALAASAACAVAALLDTPAEKPARFGTAWTLAVPVTMTLRVSGAEPRAVSGRPTPANATAAASAPATSVNCTSLIGSSRFGLRGRYAAGLRRRHVSRSRLRMRSRRTRSGRAASGSGSSASRGG